jgi:RecB family exonuclease
VDALLAEAGLAPAGRVAAADACLDALERTLADERGLWIFDPRHANAASELSVSGRVAGQLVRGIVDRRFVADDGTLWIIDYKTGGHAGGGREEFLDREELRYRGQMERYAALLAGRHEGPLRLGLYFPRLSGWREWAPSVEN